MMFANQNSHRRPIKPTGKVVGVYNDLTGDGRTDERTKTFDARQTVYSYNMVTVKIDRVQRRRVLCRTCRVVDRFFSDQSS